MSLDIKNYQLFLNDQALFAAISFNSADDSVVAITGASGSGKSTLLADLSGVLPAAFSSTGELNFDGQPLRETPIEHRKIGILFQEDLLFPHLNVCQNLMFGLPKKLSKPEKIARIKKALSQAGLANFEQRDIATLSGGQRSRIALLRTLLSQPKLILLDEPFSKLDQELRAPFRQWVFEQLAQMEIPAILVTHDSADIPQGSKVIKLETQHA